jgi:uncharacterized protein (DUF1800 family)
MTRRHFAPIRRTTGLVAVATILTLAAGPLTAQKSNGIPAKPDTQTIVHVLNRIGFGPRAGDVERVQTMGLAAYIDAQLHPEKIDDGAMQARLAEFTTLEMSAYELSQKYFVPAQQLQRDQQIKNQKAEIKNAKAGDPDMAMAGSTATPPARTPPAQLPPEVRQARQMEQNVIQELVQAKVLRAALSERQLEEVLTDFWFNHFNVYIQKGQVRQYVTEYERDAIRPYVLGSFRDLLGATAKSPAMLFYLDNFQSSAPNQNPAQNPNLQNIQRQLNNPRLDPARRQQLMQRLEQARRPQQQARGLNENYARELMELHTLGVDGGYTQQDVQEVARAFTGWTIDRPQQGGSFIVRPQMHDDRAKTILGVKFAGGGQEEGERVLDLLAKHPSTAHHIAFQLAQRFVADDPPKALVDRAAKTFLDTKGDLREVTRVIITSPEFFAKDAYRAKVKTPFEFVISAVRATGTNVVNAQPLVAAVATLGQPLYRCQPPTGYSQTADAWVNTGALLNRMNFAVSLVGDGGRGMAADGRGRGGQAPPPNRPNAGRGRGPGALGRTPLQVDIASLAPDTTAASRDRLMKMLLAGDVSDATVKTISRAENAQQLIALTLGSPEFQRR